MSQLEAALPAPQAAAYPRRWIAAAVMIVAALMDMIDATIVNVALPSIRSDLGASATQVEWIVSAYLLPFAAFLLVAGRLGDVLGRRRLFLGGIVLFGAASAVCALAVHPARLLEPVDHAGHAAALQPRQLGEPPRRQRPLLLQVAHELHVADPEPELLGHLRVEHDHVGDRADERVLDAIVNISS